MTKLLLRVSLAALLALPNIAYAQFLDNVPGPYLLGTPLTGFSQQEFQYNCTNGVPTLGSCSPVVQVGNALAPGIQPPSASYPVAITPTQVTQSPCALQKSTTVSVTSKSTASFQLIGLVNLNTIYICSAVIKPTAATVFNLIEGVGTNCGGASPAPQAVVGNMTPSQGLPFSGANDGLALASSTGLWTTHVPGDALCFTQTVSENISITLTFVQTQL